MSDVGSQEWALRTMGRLTAGDRFALMAQGLRVQARRILRRLRSAETPLDIDLEDVNPPDSQVAKQAALLCREVSPSYLLNHCHRTYLWGHIFAKARAITFDNELLYVAALLHDLGLTKAYAGCAEHAECFSLDSVQGAGALARQAAWPRERQDALAEAIVMHLNIVVPLRCGAEAHLLQAGAAMDVVGMNAETIGDSTRRAVVRQYPRENSKQAFGERLRAEMEERPGGRICYLHRRLGFGKLIRQSPFSE